jgi:hypothetical protein
VVSFRRVNPETDGASLVDQPTPLERQQVNVHAPQASTFWHHVRFDIVASVVADSSATQVVDFGAGSGMLGIWLSQRSPEIGYSFSELSPILDAELERRFGASARLSLDATIPRTSVVALLDVIEHIEDDAEALEALAARMEPGTSVVVTVPAMPWAFSSWDTELGHFRRYTRAQLRAVLEKAGFDVTECSYLFPELTVMLPVRKLRRTKRSAVDFPALAPTVNRVAYAVSSTSSRARRVWPFGSSLVAVASRSAVA